VGTCHAMGVHGWAYIVTNGYGLGMATNSKENVGLWLEGSQSHVLLLTTIWIGN
jgi:hypothetical protein